MGMRLGTLTMALAAASGAVWGEEGGHELGQVSVTAGGYIEQVDDAPASISVIDREQIEARFYQDTTDALRDVPGVIVTGGGSGDRGTDIVIRGMPSSYTLIMVDGKPVSTRESRPNGSAGFEQSWLPPLQSIERIEVVRGPMSTLYGSDAMGAWSTLSPAKWRQSGAALYSWTRSSRTIPDPVIASRAISA